MEPLFEIRPEPRPLTDRQAWIFQYVVEAGVEGLEPAELGALMHARHGRHAAGDRCQFCGSDGLQALRERAIAERVAKRGRSAYVVIGAAAESSPTVQLDELPGDTFEDIFRMGDAA